MYLEINLRQLTENFLHLASGYCGKAWAVLKADAYGHGVEHVARTLDMVKCCYGFCVARASEALLLRKITDKPVLVLGFENGLDAKRCFENGIALSCMDIEHFNNLKRVAESIEYNSVSNSKHNNSAEVKYNSEISKKQERVKIKKKKFVSIHICLNTGMNRFGGDKAFLEYALKNTEESLHIDGIFSHIATEKRYEKQFDNFIWQIDALDINKETCMIEAIHSGITIDATPSINMSTEFGCRIGIGMYGYGALGVKPAMKAIARVVCVREIRMGEWVGYGENYLAKKDMKVAIVDVGYGDGFRRVVNKGRMKFVIGRQNCEREFLLPIVGSVCMDVTILDVTEIFACKEVIAIGDKVIVMDDANAFALENNTISYEYLTCWTKRVKRVYNNK